MTKYDWIWLNMTMSEYDWIWLNITDFDSIIVKMVMIYVIVIRLTIINLIIIIIMLNSGWTQLNLGYWTIMHGMISNPYKLVQPKLSHYWPVPNLFIIFFGMSIPLFLSSILYLLKLSIFSIHSLFSMISLSCNIQD